MLGEILGGLTDPMRAEEILLFVGQPGMRERVEEAAAKDGVPVGALVASKVRHLVDHGDEEVWLDLVGAMAGSPQPAAAAVERVLARAFPDPVRVRLTRRAS
ncbi:hypothetical protein [Muricoccus pecuniae]|uniref:Uncharacterized protein n=1 Tax=Muricoccus pecuniae TaxID=693023 RepID=A0A840Y3J0_9PROT|nr:hypothetical protein [Roseomonas pecuniae]MBB5695285.1 hypothetical protein [Roseomonas pecuniae]